jgi:salicylate 5-hydroxylase large subunit
MTEPAVIDRRHDAADAAALRRWPGSDTSRIPYWLYTDAAIYRRELDRIFYGPHWCYVGLAAEIPEPGDFKTTMIGERPVIVVRGEAGELSVLENRCAHRGVSFCLKDFGNNREFVCPYHQWTYDLGGRLTAVAFLRGVKRRGGMPADFRLEEHGLTRLAVAERHGVVFASFDPATPDFASYLGPKMLAYFDRLFDGRRLEILGYSRQRIPGNWKLMMENIKDPYHPGLLHVFFVNFGLFRADQPARIEMDETGMHGVLVSQKGEQVRNEVTAGMRRFDLDLALADDRILDPVKEFPGSETVVMQTLFPNIILQQQTNSLSTRHIWPKGPGSFDFVWTHFGYADDTAEMRRRRLRQANMFGPAGFVSLDDGEVIEMAQRGFGPHDEAQAVVEMGGRGTEDTDYMVTEASIRKFYAYYRGVMGL